MVSTLCGDACETPVLIVDLLFWLGYFNSTMNPIIYAYFNRDFRNAFKDTLRNIYTCGRAEPMRKPAPDWTHLEVNGMHAKV